MLGIVERILAALIILALLTLLIILAFPVPPRQPVGAPPSNETQRADKTPDPAPPPPTPAPAPGSTSAPKQPPAKAVEPVPVVKKSAERLPETRVPPPPPPVIVEKTPQPSVLAKSDRERIVDSRVEVYPPRRIAAARRDPLVVKRERVRRGPALVDDCGRECFDDCCCDTRDRPYWAKPKRNLVVERGDPDWADSPRRRRWAGIPPGVCPE